MKLICLSALVVVLVLGSTPASAQPVISAKAGVVAYTEGRVLLGNDVLEATSTKFPEMKENQVLRTEDGRAEVLLTPGVVLHLGENSSLRLITNRLIDTRVELLEGSAVVDALELAKDTNVTFVCKNGTVMLAKSGHYRFDAEPARLRVFAGLAKVEIGGQHVEVAGGKAVGLGGDIALAEKFDKESTDALENWSRRRAQVMAMANVSAARSSFAPSGSGLWRFNPYYGMYTYLPGTGRFCDSFYGYCYWSPSTVHQVFYRPPQPSIGNGFGGGMSPSYPSMGATSTGYSGTMASAPAAVSAPAAASSGSSAASSAGHSSVGGGSGAGGGRGH